MGIERTTDDTFHPTATGAPDPAWPGFGPEALALPEGLPAPPVPPLPEAAGLPPASRGDEVAALGLVMRGIASRLAPPEALAATLAWALRATGSHAGSLWLLQRDGSMRRVAHRGLTDDYLQAFVRVSNWREIQNALTSAASVTLADFGRHSLITAAFARVHAMIGVHTIAILPLRARGARLGVMLMGHGQHGWFERYSRDYLALLGDLVADALDDARRIADLRAAGGRHLELLRAARLANDRERAAREMLARMLQSVSAGVALVDPAEGRVLEHNPAFSWLAGRSPERDVSGSRLDVLWPGLAETALGALLAGVASERRPSSAIELEVPWPGPVPSRWSAAVAPLEQGGEPRLLLTIHDLTERRALDEQARQTQKLEAIATLAAGVADRFNNLLTAVLGNLALARTELPGDHALRAGLADAEAAARRAAELTHELLEFGRRAPLRLERADLREVLDQALERMADELDPRIVVERREATSLPQVIVDPTQFLRLVMNLCANAADAMPDGGRIVLSLVRDDAPARGHGPHVRLEVHDTGAGMTPDVRARIYDPFFTTKGPGRCTGLGLSVAHGIAEQHGGWIECESSPGQGTSFRVHLPVAGPMAGPSGTPEARSETVLVADPDAATRALAQAVVERQGWHALVAGDAAEAIELAGREQPDLVLWDGALPAGALSSLPPGLGVVHMGVEPAAGWEPRPQRPGTVFLRKPFAPERLIATVRRALQTRP